MKISIKHATVAAGLVAAIANAHALNLRSVERVLSTLAEIATSPAAQANPYIPGILQLIAQISPIIPKDERNGEYTVALTAISFAKHSQSALALPTAQNVHVPGTILSPNFTPCGLTGISIPTTDEHLVTPDQYKIMALQYIQQALPVSTSAEESGAWGLGEDPESVVKAWTLDLKSEIKVLEKYPKKTRYSPKTFEHFVFHGFAQDKIERVRANDPYAKTRRGPATYAVYLDFMEGLQIRDGYVPYGGNAYFNHKGKLQSIVRGGEVFSKKSKEWETVVSYMRGSAFVWATAHDHLMEIHLSVANGLATATVEKLSPTHPIRRLITPFTYGSEAVNLNAHISLAGEFGSLPRMFSFTTQGLEDAFTASRAKLSGPFETIPERFAKQGIDGKHVELDYHIDGLEFYSAVENFVKSYVSLHYPNGDCAADAELSAWYERYDSVHPAQMPVLTCENLIKVLASSFHQASAGHNHFGNIYHISTDPCFAPTALVPDDICAPPSEAATTAMITGSTSLDMPKILEDYGHMFEDTESKDLWADFKQGLLQVGANIAARNEKREFPFRSFSPEIIETAVGV